MYKHTWVKKFHCNQCDKLFVTSSDLNKHLKVHEASRNVTTKKNKENNDNLVSNIQNSGRWTISYLKFL